MSVHDIIEKYYKSGDIKRIVSRIKISSNRQVNEQIKDDLVHEVVDILMHHKNPQRLIEIDQEGNFGYYISGIVSRMVYGQNSNYYRDVVEYEKRKVSIENRSQANSLQGFL